MDELKEFEVDGLIQIKEVVKGFPTIVVTNAFASAEVYLHGGHVTHFQPNGHPPVLWMSEIAQFQAGKAIRGGIPLIFPWFGAHPTDSSKPSHGFARRMNWELLDAVQLETGETELTLTLFTSTESEAVWDVPFSAVLTIRIGTELTVALQMVHYADEPQTITCALHSYFAVGDIHQTSISGVDGRTYIDQPDNRSRKVQEGDIHFDGELDRIYVGSEDSCTITDPALNRKIIVKKNGSKSTVIWNPWIVKSASMGDFPDDGYLKMVCVEAANAAEDAQLLQSGEIHTISTTIASQFLHAN